MDEAGRNVAAGTTGELILRGDNIMRGYFRMPEETAAVLKDGLVLYRRPRGDRRWTASIASSAVRRV